MQFHAERHKVDGRHARPLNYVHFLRRDPGDAEVIGAVLFDFDGLIVDTESAYRLAWAPVLRPEHLDKFDEIASGRREEEVAHLMVPFLRAGVSGADHALTLKRLEFARLMADPRFMRPLPGIRELVGKLSPAHRLHVVSNSTFGSVDESLRLLSLREPFERLHCWAPGRRPKPAPDLYEAASESLGLPKSQVVALEDSRTGLAAAAAARVPVVCVGNDPAVAAYCREHGFPRFTSAECLVAIDPTAWIH